MRFTLRYKLVSLILLSFTIQTAFLVWVGRESVSQQFLVLEEREAERNAMQAANTLSATVTALEEKSADWAQWDDAYEFMANKSEEFMQSNLPIETLSELGIDALIWVKPDRRTVYHFTLVPRKSGQVALNVSDIVKGTLGANPNSQAEVSGFVDEGANMFTFSAKAVVRSTGEGPLRGYLIMVRAIAGRELNALSNTVKSSVSLKKPSSEAASLLVPVASQTRRSRVLWVDRVNENTIRSHYAIKDVAKKTIRILSLENSRHIYWLGTNAINMVTWAVILLALLAGIALLGSVEAVAVSRITKLLLQLQAVTGDVTGNISIRGRDEISDIALETNKMLERIRENRTELEASQAELLDLNETLESVVAQRTRELAEKTKILENALTGIAVVDPNEFFEQVNAEFATVLGGTTSEVTGRSWREFVDPAFHGAVKRSIVMARLNGRAELEVSGLTLSCSVFHGQMVFVAEAGATTADDPIHCFLRDITSHKELERSIWTQAFHDSLTGLPNRRLFQQRIEETIRKSEFGAQSLAVLYMDLDNFKFVNDSLGHEVGDKLLMEVASRLTAAVGNRGVVSRFGGDEFTILLQSVSGDDDALKAAGKVIANVCEPMMLADREFVCTASIGVALISGHAETEDVLRNADTALYAAKSKGKNQAALFTKEMFDAVIERLEVERDLRIAVEHEAFSVLYQPILRVSNSEIVGVEALVRWNDPANRIVSPAKFIPIAEEIGIVGKIGSQVLRDACRNGALWKDLASSEFKVNVNISVLQLHDPDFPELVESVLRKAGLAPYHLCLEITETVMVSDAEFVIAQLKRIRGLGVSIALDDFGSGFSSLSYLRALPVNQVKIDRSFIEGIEDSQGNLAVVRSLAQLAGDLGMETTGEGVEAEAQFALLKSAGVTFAQGYLFSKPVTASEIPGLFGRGGRLAA